MEMVIGMLLHIDRAIDSNRYLLTPKGTSQRWLVYVQTTRIIIKLISLIINVLKRHNKMPSMYYSFIVWNNYVTVRRIALNKNNILPTNFFPGIA